MTDNDFQERVELFATLKSKYQVSDYEDSSLSSPLYLILRKVDLGIELIEFELNWLKEHGLYRIREFVLQDKAHRKKVLKLEFSNLKHKYNATNYILPWQTSSLYLILCKLDSGEQLTDSEMKWLKDNHLHKTIAIAQEISHFIKLKAKYQATKHQDSSHSSPLYPILKRVDAKEGLNDEDINWLKSNELVETLRVMEAQFAKLKAKYQATKHSDSSVSSPLYQILQNIDAGEPLSESEVNWLKEHDLIETLELVQEIEQKRHFADLKMEYKAIQYEDSSPSSHLYKVLKQIDSGTQLSDSNTHFLRKHKLTETLKLAVDKYAANLELKIKSGIQLSQADIDWLKQNALQDKITSLVDMYVEQLCKAQSGNPLTTADIDWLKQIGREDIVTLFQELKHYAVLTERYDLSDSQYKPPSYQSRLYAILQKLDKGERLEPKDFAWLTGERLIYHDSKIFTTYHEIEATFYEQEYKRTRNKWNLVNASSHWRKVVQPERALKQTDNLKFDKIKDNRLKSALKTTRGGAFRDIDELDKAEQCARQAIEYNPSSHHPYTLMGAICYERGQYSDGHYWFDEAIKHGASPSVQDAEIKRVLKNADKDKRKKVVEYMLKKDPVRYKWAKKYISTES
jgi:hypothetical protein